MCQNQHSIISIRYIFYLFQLRFTQSELIAVEQGDRLGFTTTSDQVPIAYVFQSGAKLLSKGVDGSKFPAVGDNITFIALRFPYTFSYGAEYITSKFLFLSSYIISGKCGIVHIQNVVFILL